MSYIHNIYNRIVLLLIRIEKCEDQSLEVLDGISCKITPYIVRYYFVYTMEDGILYYSTFILFKFYSQILLENSNYI